MNRIMSPWELAYEKLKEHYSKDQIKASLMSCIKSSDTLWREVEELLIREEPTKEDELNPWKQ